MRFDTQPHRFYCGIDRHARTMSVPILDATGGTRFAASRSRFRNPYGVDPVVLSSRRAARRNFWGAETLMEPDARFLKLRAATLSAAPLPILGGAAVFERARRAQAVLELSQAAARARPSGEADQFRLVGVLADGPAEAMTPLPAPPRFPFRG